MKFMYNGIKEVDPNEFIEFLLECGWKDTCDAQQSNITKLLSKLCVLKVVDVKAEPSPMYKACFMYLDSLYASGQDTTPAALIQHFDYDVQLWEAENIVQDWYETFNERFDIK